MRRRLATLALLGLLAFPALARADLDALVWFDAPEPAPDAIVFQDEKGSALTLASFRGRVVLLNFWATWCAPCRREMPSLDALEARFGGPDFMVLALSEDRGGVVDVRPFFDELGLEHLAIHVDKDMALARAFRVVGLPATYIIDHEGRVLARLLGDAAWDSDAAMALLEPLIVKARDARATTTTTSSSCSCGGPKASRVARYGTVAPPPDD